ncbi:MAG: hypothetical protein C0404_01560 [Verrucomicrobia bacterium]|nr:hypothetical protein [Verrucomicrobiota bacterium]
MTMTLFYGAIRFIVLLIEFSLVIAFAHRVTGFNYLDKKKHRVGRLIQESALSLLFVCFALDIYSYVTSTAWAGVNPGLLGIVVGLSPWCAIGWVVLAFLLIFSVFYFRRTAWARYREIEGMLNMAEADADTLMDGSIVQKIYLDLDQLCKVFPPGLKQCCTGLQERIRRMKSLPPDVLIGRAALLLQRQRQAEALKWVIQWNSRSSEALLLAVECHDWKECVQLMNGDAPALLKVEAAQLMADLAPDEDFRNLGVNQLGGEMNARRRAAIEYRRGNVEKAANMLSNDHEARAWVKSVKSDE